MGKETKRYVGIICSLFMYFVYVILLTVRTKMLIGSYGSEVNAVFQTSSQIFTYLILFESGMSAAYQFKLYEPVNDKDMKKIAGLFNGLKKSMRKIALRMTAVLLVIAVIYPLIMNRVSISFMKAGLILCLLGIRFVIPYFVSIANKTLLNVYDYKYVVDNVDSHNGCGDSSNQVTSLARVWCFADRVYWKYCDWLGLCFFHTESLRRDPDRRNGSGF